MTIEPSRRRKPHCSILGFQSTGPNIQVDSGTHHGGQSQSVKNSSGSLNDQMTTTNSTNFAPNGGTATSGPNTQVLSTAQKVAQSQSISNSPNSGNLQLSTEGAFNSNSGTNILFGSGPTSQTISRDQQGGQRQIVMNSSRINQFPSRIRTSQSMTG